jgi:hypothetical protein
MYKQRAWFWCSYDCFLFRRDVTTFVSRLHCHRSVAHEIQTRPVLISTKQRQICFSAYAPRIKLTSWTTEGRHKNKSRITVAKSDCIRPVFLKLLFLAFHCHNTKHVHVSLSQYKTCTRITVTIQNMYAYHCHNRKNVHVPLSQYKTRTRTTATTRNMYAYHCHNTKHVHVPLSQ